MRSREFLKFRHVQNPRSRARQGSTARQAAVEAGNSQDLGLAVRSAGGSRVWSSVFPAWRLPRRAAPPAGPTSAMKSEEGEVTQGIEGSGRIR